MSVHAPPFAKGADQLTAAIAVAEFKDSDFAIDCDGCTACCHGDDGPIILPEEYNDYACHKDDKGNMRLDQEDGRCVYLEDGGCGIHGPAFELQVDDPALACRPDVQAYLEECTERIHQEIGTPPRPPKICRDFDCRSVIIKFNTRGLDYMVNSRQLPLDVVIQGRAKLKQFNDMINTRALAGGVDLSPLLMVEGDEDAPHDAA